MLQVKYINITDILCSATARLSLKSQMRVSSCEAQCCLSQEARAELQKAPSSVLRGPHCLAPDAGSTANAHVAILCLTFLTGKMGAKINT